MGFHKHSFSLLGTLQIFLSENSFAVTLCVYIHTNTQLYLCLFFKKKMTSPHFWPAPDHFLWSRHEGAAETEAVGEPGAQHFSSKNHLHLLTVPLLPAYLIILGKTEPFVLPIS